MSTKPKNRDRRGRRKGAPRRSDFRRPERPRPPCAICGEPIQDITSALSRPADGEAVHFDCALKSAEEQLSPVDGEKVVYLGSGGFAAVELEAYQKRKLKIIRRSEWEKADEKSEWRTKLRTDLD